MNEINDFIDWLWSVEPALAPRVQDRYTYYLSMIPKINRPDTGIGDSFIIDGKYRVTSAKRGLLLYHLNERDAALLAVYQSPGNMFADLIAHSIRNQKASSIQEFTAEVTRLATLCEQEWINFTGGNHESR
ncbi:hypothetical protein F6A15_10610 [Salmonella enterica]|nr:hypothetical protein [Salmonella enterica]